MLFHRATTDSCPADSQSSDRSVLWRKRQTLSRSTPLQPPESHPSPVGEGDGPLLNSAKEIPMTDFEKIELAFDILESSEVMHEFDDCIWISVDKEMYLQLNGSTTQGDLDD